MKTLLATALLLALASPATAAEPPADANIVMIPAECMQFWSIADDASSPMVWDAMLSFAGCVQDARVYRVADADELPTFVAQLHTSLGPALQFYVVAIYEGPTVIKLRAAYHIGLGQVALLTRARMSIVPQLGPALEPLLEQHAKLAYLIFTLIERAADSNPALARDPVNRYMVQSSRELAASLRADWSIPLEDGPLFALPR
jgi:hypothetical protein